MNRVIQRRWGMLNFKIAERLPVFKCHNLLLHARADYFENLFNWNEVVGNMNSSSDMTQGLYVSCVGPLLSLQLWITAKKSHTSISTKKTITFPLQAPIFSPKLGNGLMLTHFYSIRCFLYIDFGRMIARRASPASSYEHCLLFPNINNSIVIPFLSDGSEASENIHAFLQQYSSTTFILLPNAKCYGILRYRLRKEFVSCRTSSLWGKLEVINVRTWSIEHGQRKSIAHTLLYFQR